MIDFNKKIDLIFFSGDLLSKPSEQGFENVFTNFIKPSVALDI